MQYCVGGYTANFTQYALRVVGLISAGLEVNDHFAPQWRFCDLQLFKDRYDVVFNDSALLGERIHALLQSYGLDRYFYEWGKKGENLTAFEENAKHVTNAKERLRDFYSPWLARRVHQAFKKDYLLFGLPLPHWLQGEW